MVNEGDSIIQIDPTDVNGFILVRETSLETELANFEKIGGKKQVKLKKIQGKPDIGQSLLKIKLIDNLPYIQYNEEN